MRSPIAFHCTFNHRFAYQLTPTVVAMSRFRRTASARGLVEGVLVPPRDPEALAVALGALLDNPARRAALGEVALETAKRYAWDVVAGQVAEVYRGVLGSSR